jgi:hypothetical protein
MVAIQRGRLGEAAGVGALVIFGFTLAIMHG